MADLESLLNDLANLDAQHDLDGLRSVREAIVRDHPGSDAAAEALYKLGLDFLFRQRHIQAAIESFAEAAKRKHDFWSAAARTSLGLCYYHQGRLQKALFELRRVAYTDKPTAHSVTALAFMESIFETEGSEQEIKKTRKERIGQLETLAQAAGENSAGAGDRGYHLYQLGLALRDDGDNDRADEVLKQAKALGPEVLGADLYRSIVEAL